MGDVENQQKAILALEVTEEQKETTYHLLSHSNWDFNESEIKINENKVTDVINQEGTPEHFDNCSKKKNKGHFNKLQRGYSKLC